MAITSLANTSVPCPSCSRTGSIYSPHLQIAPLFPNRPIELSELGRQRLDERIPSLDTLRRGVAAWQAEPNDQQSTIVWQFTTADAAAKLSKLNNLSLPD